MQVSPETQKKLKVWSSEHKAMGKSPEAWENGLPARLSLNVAEDILRRLEKHVVIKGKRILDIGSGMGDFILACYNHEAIPCGIEPNHEHVDFAKSWFKDNKAEIDLRIAKGEELPFKEDTFDIASCINVLEHVSNPDAVVREIVRVLKPGGIFFLMAPNYMFPREPHYSVFYPPFLPKRLAKIYLKIIGKPSSFIDHINYITLPYLLRITKKAGLRVKANWIDDIVLNPSLVSQKRQRFVVKALRFFHVPKLLISLLSPNITLVLVKCESGEDNTFQKDGANYNG